VICDATAIASAISAAGWPDVRGVADVDTWRDRTINTAVLLCTDPVAFTTSTLDEPLAAVPLLHVPLHAFDPKPRIAVYTMERLRQTSFARAVARNRSWVRRLERELELRFTGTRTRQIDLSCIPADNLNVATAATLELPEGVAMPVGPYFEVEMERDAGGGRPFTVNGTLHVDGLVYAVGEEFRGDAASARALADGILQAAQPHGLRIEIRDNVLVSCRTAEGGSLLPHLAEAAGGDLALSEFAIGTNRLAHPDFSVNAQVNEGAGGIHVGIGGGPDAVHIDFVALAARRAKA
jgi:hypothetical protein